MSTAVYPASKSSCMDFLPRIIQLQLHADKSARGYRKNHPNHTHSRMAVRYYRGYGVEFDVAFYSSPPNFSFIVSFGLFPYPKDERMRRRWNLRPGDSSDRDVDRGFSLSAFRRTRRGRLRVATFQQPHTINKEGSYIWVSE